MLPSSHKRQDLIRSNAITGTCFKALGKVLFSFQLPEEQSFTLSVFYGAEFQC